MRENVAGGVDVVGGFRDGIDDEDSEGFGTAPAVVACWLC